MREGSSGMGPMAEFGMGLIPFQIAGGLAEGIVSGMRRQADAATTAATAHYVRHYSDALSKINDVEVNQTTTFYKPGGIKYASQALPLLIDGNGEPIATRADGGPNINNYPKIFIDGRSFIGNEEFNLGVGFLSENATGPLGDMSNPSYRGCGVPDDSTCTSRSWSMADPTSSDYAGGGAVPGQGYPTNFADKVSDLAQNAGLSGGICQTFFETISTDTGSSDRDWDEWKPSNCESDAKSPPCKYNNAAWKIKHQIACGSGPQCSPPTLANDNVCNNAYGSSNPFCTPADTGKCSKDQGGSGYQYTGTPFFFMDPNVGPAITYDVSGGKWKSSDNLKVGLTSRISDNTNVFQFACNGMTSWMGFNWSNITDGDIGFEWYGGGDASPVSLLKGGPGGDSFNAIVSCITEDPNLRPENYTPPDECANATDALSNENFLVWPAPGLISDSGSAGLNCYGYPSFVLRCDPLYVTPWARQQGYSASSAEMIQWRNNFEKSQHIINLFNIYMYGVVNVLTSNDDKTWDQQSLGDNSPDYDFSSLMGPDFDGLLGRGIDVIGGEKLGASLMVPLRGFFGASRYSSEMGSGQMAFIDDSTRSDGTYQWRNPLMDPLLWLWKSTGDVWSCNQWGGPLLMWGIFMQTSVVDDNTSIDGQGPTSVGTMDGYNQSEPARLNNLKTTQEAIQFAANSIFFTSYFKDTGNQMYGNRSTRPGDQGDVTDDQGKSLSPFTINPNFLNVPKSILFYSFYQVYLEITLNQVPPKGSITPLWVLFFTADDDNTTGSLELKNVIESFYNDVQNRLNLSYLAELLQVNQYSYGSEIATWVALNINTSDDDFNIPQCLTDGDKTVKFGGELDTCNTMDSSQLTKSNQGIPTNANGLEINCFSTVGQYLCPRNVWYDISGNLSGGINNRIKYLVLEASNELNNDSNNNYKQGFPVSNLCLGKLYEIYCRDKLSAEETSDVNHCVGGVIEDINDKFYDMYIHDAEQIVIDESDIHMSAIYEYNDHINIPPHNDFPEKIQSTGSIWDCILGFARNIDMGPANHPTYGYMIMPTTPDILTTYAPCNYIRENPDITDEDGTTLTNGKLITMGYNEVLTEIPETLTANTTSDVERQLVGAETPPTYILYPRFNDYVRSMQTMYTQAEGNTALPSDDMSLMYNFMVLIKDFPFVSRPHDKENGTDQGNNFTYINGVSASSNNGVYSSFPSAEGSETPAGGGRAGGGVVGGATKLGNFGIFDLINLDELVNSGRRFKLTRCSFYSNFNWVKNEFWLYGDTYHNLFANAAMKLHMGNEMRMLTAYYRDCGLLTHMSGVILDMALPNSNDLKNRNGGSSANPTRKAAVQQFRWFYEDQVRVDAWDTEEGDNMAEWVHDLDSNSSAQGLRSTCFLRNYLRFVLMNRNHGDSTLNKYGLPANENTFPKKTLGIPYTQEDGSVHFDDAALPVYEKYGMTENDIQTNIPLLRHLEAMPSLNDWAGQTEAKIKSLGLYIPGSYLPGLGVVHPLEGAGQVVGDHERAGITHHLYFIKPNQFKQVDVAAAMYNLDMGGTPNFQKKDEKNIEIMCKLARIRWATMRGSYFSIMETAAWGGIEGYKPTDWFDCNYKVAARGKSNNCTDGCQFYGGRSKRRKGTGGGEYSNYDSNIYNVGYDDPQLCINNAGYFTSAKLGNSQQKRCNGGQTTDGMKYPDGTSTSGWNSEGDSAPTFFNMPRPWKARGYNLRLNTYYTNELPQVERRHRPEDGGATWWNFDYCQYSLSPSHLIIQNLMEYNKYCQGEYLGKGIWRRVVFYDENLPDETYPRFQYYNLGGNEMSVGEQGVPIGGCWGAPRDADGNITGGGGGVDGENSYEFTSYELADAAIERLFRWAVKDDTRDELQLTSRYTPDESGNYQTRQIGNTRYTAITSMQHNYYKPVGLLPKIFIASRTITAARCHQLNSEIFKAQTWTNNWWKGQDGVGIGQTDWTSSSRTCAYRSLCPDDDFQKGSQIRWGAGLEGNMTVFGAQMNASPWNINDSTNEFRFGTPLGMLSGFWGSYVKGWAVDGQVVTEDYSNATAGGGGMPAHNSIRKNGWGGEYYYYPH